MIHAQEGRVIDSSAFDALLGGSDFGGAAAVQRRAAVSPDWMLLPEPVGGAPAAATVVVRFRAALDRDAVHARCKALCAARGAVDDTEGTCVLRIKGRVPITGHDGLFALQCVTLSAHVALTAAPLRTGMDAGQGLLAVSGCGVTAALAEQFVTDCLPPRPQPRPMRRRAELSAAELEAVREAHRGDALPEGYFHTGRAYVCMDGSKSAEHPLFDEWVDEWIRQWNADAEAFNAELQASAAVARQEDVFVRGDAGRSPSTRAALPPARPPSGAGRRRRSPQKKEGAAP